MSETQQHHTEKAPLSVLLFGNLMLCQDCNHILEFDEAGHDGEYSCRCGGDYCGCNDCSNEAEKALQEQDKQRKGLTAST